MQRMELEAAYPKRKVTLSSKEHNVYPYLLKGADVTRPNQVWATDITYIRMRRGFLFNGSHGLVQPLRAELAFVEYAGYRFLPRRAARCSGQTQIPRDI